MVIGIDGNEANVENRVGSGNYAFQLLNQFSKIDNHEFVIYLKDHPKSDLPKESENFKYNVFGPGKLWTQIALPLSLTFGIPKSKFNKPDVFFSMAHYGPRFSKIPYVVTIHDLSYIHFPELFNKDDLYQLKNWTKYSAKNSKKIIVPSNSTKDDVINNYKVNSSKVVVTYEGYDEKLFLPQPKQKIDDVKTKYKIKKDYIIFVGTLQPRKNIERLIDAFSSIIHDSDIDIQLVIAGKKGWQFEQIFEKVKAKQLQDKIIFTDYVANEDLPALISGAKVYVNPSLWEGFGIPVIEAQACGIPVVVSNTSSLPEIVNKSGMVIDPDNTDEIASAILVVLTDEKIRSELIKKGFENIKRFSWENCAQETLSVLQKAAEN